jgi:hypothetical protein
MKLGIQLSLSLCVIMEFSDNGLRIGEEADFEAQNCL